MKQLFLYVLLSVLFFSCRTEKTELKSPNGVEFFTSRTQLSDEVQKAVTSDFKRIYKFSVKKIDYYEDAKQSVGLVTYEVNETEHTNLVIVVTPTSKKIYTCKTDGCLCSAEIIKDTATGEVSYECGGCDNACHWEVTQL